MIHNIVEENVNWALPTGIGYLLAYGKRGSSRNGPVIVAPGPVCTAYTKPWQRVLFSPVRDANPFFHFMESLWMLNGDNDVAWPAFFAKNILNYSDDGKTMNGAYGHRWRNHFDFDQLDFVIEELARRPDGRRVVLSMWDPRQDVPLVDDGGKDVPCNTHAYFSVRDGALDMFVSCRSNDIIWGAYGANVVHFSFLMEYIASWLNVKMGRYYQLSYNYHLYSDKYPDDELKRIIVDSKGYNEYSRQLTIAPLRDDGMEREEWERQLQRFMLDPENSFADDCTFFGRVARPMYKAWLNRKLKVNDGTDQVNKIVSDDWRIACLMWIKRREKC